MVEYRAKPDESNEGNAVFFAGPKAPVSMEKLCEFLKKLI